MFPVYCKMAMKYYNMKHYIKYTVLQYSAHCCITYLFTVILQTFSCILQPASIVKSWLRTWSRIVALFIRNVSVSLDSSTSSFVLPPRPSPCSLTPLLFLAVVSVHFLLVLPLSEIVTLCGARRTGWSLVDLTLHTFPFISESQDSPESNSSIVTVTKKILQVQ